MAPCPWHPHHLAGNSVKNQSAWRPVLGILTILQDLVPVLGVGKAGGGGFELPELMEWVGKCFSSANGEVRSAAVRVTKEVYDLVGPAVRRLLPNDISPKIKEQLDALLGGAMMEEALPPPPPQPHHVAANSRAAKSARGGGVAPPPPSTGSSARAGGPPPSTASSRSGASAPAKQLPNAKKGGAPAMASLPEPTTASGDDPAPYLEELAQRERQFGKDHPRVAETASNLAILYNQHGDAASALPLYERALVIYEKAYGPDHADVAHTLTDLAVLHLEQGNEAVGRPLLERALVIQEAALGPDHPDVIAIKDVLNS
ncbi:hypothetical protein CEUSTIGMA_g10692.t1 [Chlamydomonas eustigma]|uniref:Uncharacterized protein n=1 Tax=Chlamydomonas eustigma TaxID=1157962 RepID=A0A250XJS4_9CHLO|nr:hypothetical protein CEUSTIGMA_g10692.t1 [Chlamydomonas eustigma]|eukprot:GAX83266.1 hypothetical protein CEUSTIGMA_g10692.t1 [Chlamydomonas eustigma]